MKILIITPGFPYKNNNDYMFVKQLVDEFSNFGHQCVVISPKSVTSKVIRKKISYPIKSAYKCQKNSYEAYFPKFISFSSLPILRRINGLLYDASILRTIKKHDIQFDVVYSHFLIRSGISANNIFKKYHKPFFIASGESSFSFKGHIGNKKMQETFDNVFGMVAVSTEIKERLLNLEYNINQSKIKVFPNGFNPQKFFPMNKDKLRKKYNINQKYFIISFVGWFSDRKGILRLDRALREINKDDIRVLYIGSGEMKPSYENVLYEGPIEHDKLNEYLNLSDVFVLPTLNEGSCNAIIEAVGAGLPIISSKDKFNDDILNKENSIRIDPNSINEIKNAILELYNNRSKLKKMSEASIIKSKEHHLKIRARKILAFILGVTDNNTQ